jgi:transcriptional regulator with XRE-family HTH domain
MGVYSYVAMAATDSSLDRTLQRLRQQAGLSLRDLEERSGVSRAIISRLEHGENKNSRPSTLTKLAEALGVDASELLTAAGYTASQAQALPSMRPYLRTKYGHLPVGAQRELARLLERLEAEHGGRRRSK